MHIIGGELSRPTIVISVMENQKEIAQAFDEVVKNRRSVRHYDQDAPFDPDAVDRSLDRALLSPNSNNLQLWEFIRVRSDEMREKLSHACFSQPAAKTARELLIVLARPDLWESRNKKLIEHFESVFPDKEHPSAKGLFQYYEVEIPKLYQMGYGGFAGHWKKWKADQKGTGQPVSREVGPNDVRISAHRTAALAAQTFMLSIKAEGYDSCPMEGFDSKMVKGIFDIPPKAEINMIIGVGPGKDEGIYGPRLRLPKEEVVFER